MILRPNDKRSQLFTLRVWPEEISAGHTVWRGKIQRVVDGETLYFHDWEAMMAFLLHTLEEGPGSRVQGPARDDLEP